MKIYKVNLFFMLCLWVACNQAPESTEEAKEEVEPTSTTYRLVSLNGTITELLYQLDLGDQVVGVDVTSTYPESTANLDNLGHVSKINTEAVLALNPTHILISESDKQQPTIQQLEAAGAKLVTINLENTLASAPNAAKTIAQELGVEDLSTVEQLNKKVDKNKAALAEVLAKANTQPKVLFIYARGTKTLMVAGQETFAEDMIRLAGGQNAVQGIESFKALTPEALLQAQPDVILMFNSGLQSLREGDQGATEALLGLPGMAETPAGKNKQVIAMDGLYLSGFGPRASAAALELAKQLHQTETIQ